MFHVHFLISLFLIPENWHTTREFLGQNIGVSSAATLIWRQRVDWRSWKEYLTKRREMNLSNVDLRSKTPENKKKVF